MDAKQTSQNRTRSLWIALGALVIGLLIGLVVLGWWAFPVQWTDASPADLLSNYQVDYLRAAVDSFWVTFDANTALQRYNYLGEDGPSALATVQADPSADPTQVAAYSAVITEGQQQGLLEEPTGEAAQQGMGNVTRILTALLLIVAVAGLLVWLVFRARGQEPVGEPPAAAETPSLAVSEIRQEETRAGEVPAGGDTHPVRVPTGDTQPVITTPQEQPPPMWIPEEEQPEPGLEPGVGQEPAGEADTVRTLLESAESQPVPRADLAETQGDTAPVTIEELTGAEPGMAGTVPAASEATAAGEEAVPSVEAGEATPTGEAAAYQPGSPVYQLAAIRGIGTDYAEQLAAIGITTPGELLEQGATPRGRQAIVEQSGISGRLILEWVNYVDLFRVNGVTSEYADLLAAAGVDTLVELAMSNPDSLQRSLAALNESRQLLGEPPTPSLVKEWVEQAKNLPRKIYY